jgi:hypothetical protein
MKETADDRKVSDNAYPLLVIATKLLLAKVL